MGEQLDLSERDYTLAAQKARDNRALQRVFKEFKASRLMASIEGQTVEEREQARTEYKAALLILAELEVLATQPDDGG